MLAALLIGLLAAPLPPPYPTMCAPCHGESGAGDGPAADLLWPRPTPLVGAPLPLGDDPASVRRAIVRGVPGTAMPAFGGALPPDAIEALVAAIARSPAAAEADPSAPSGDSPAHLDPTLWRATGCAGCHGEAGAGDGPLAPTLRDANGDPADLFDLRRAPLKGGDSPAALYTTLTRGRPGTPMPAFAALSETDRRRLVAHLRALRTGSAPGPEDPHAPSGVPDTAPTRTPAHHDGTAPLTPAHSGAHHDPPAPTSPSPPSDPPQPVTHPDTHPHTLTPASPAAPTAHADTAPAALHLPLPAAPTAHPDTTPPALRLPLPAAPTAHDPPPPALRLPPPGAPPRAHDPYWRPLPLPDPGPPPPALLPPLADPTPERCGTCHPAQHATWAHSRHAVAAGPGLRAQFPGAPPDFAPRCNACHAPLAPQQRDPAAHARGITCAACHLRDHHKHGPPGPSAIRFPAPALAPRVEPRFARSDFCLPCHNLPLSAAVDGRPLLDTWREWAQSPYLPAGVQCQHCHMPDGAHAVPGAHDPAMARRAVTLTATAALDGAHVTATATIRNTGAGHHFPTTATPRAVLRVRQIGPDGPLVGTEETWAIGRTVRHDGRRWIEDADTRIAAGATLTRRYRRPRAPAAERLEVSLHLFPDWFYTRFYRTALRRPELEPAARADYAAALAEAEASVILIDHRRLPLPAR